MKYLIIGAGGTGGAAGGFLARAGRDVTLIARGRHLEKIQKEGMRFETPEGSFTVPACACTMEEYSETPDVIFVCVKGYSLDETVPFIRRIAGEKTVVIPILNIYGTGGRLQKQLPEITVTDGCIYIVSEIKEPGTILLSSRIFRVVFGFRTDTPEQVREEYGPVLEAVREDLQAAGIQALLSDQIEKDALQKFSYISPAAAVGACYDAPSGEMQAEGPLRELFVSLIGEIRALSAAMGADLPENIAELNLNIMDGLAPDATTSMQRDIRDGKPSEIDGLVYEVVRMGEKWNVPVPAYREIAGRLRQKLQAGR